MLRYAMNILHTLQIHATLYTSLDLQEEVGIDGHTLF